ncbi:hypothetical protein GLE_1748 [Lysobacter enzymogenes]|uniref:Uncharacterized protein n=1 Tax=Lysobacter enzymogenes TaxID=69 RepID=A0A0S2DFK6_LYSEN|nr:hypothetical protein GLE_1748 [Lysobacter enzymogenes]
MNRRVVRTHRPIAPATVPRAASPRGTEPSCPRPTLREPTEFRRDPAHKSHLVTGSPPACCGAATSPG